MEITPLPSGFGPLREYTHLAAMSLDYMQWAFEWSNTDFHIPSPLLPATLMTLGEWAMLHGHFGWKSFSSNGWTIWMR